MKIAQDICESGSISLWLSTWDKIFRIKWYFILQQRILWALCTLPYVSKFLYTLQTRCFHCFHCQLQQNGWLASWVFAIETIRVYAKALPWCKKHFQNSKWIESTNKLEKEKLSTINSRLCNLCLSFGPKSCK